MSTAVLFFAEKPFFTPRTPSKIRCWLRRSWLLAITFFHIKRYDITRKSNTVGEYRLPSYKQYRLTVFDLNTRSVIGFTSVSNIGSIDTGRKSRRHNATVRNGAEYGGKVVVRLHHLKLTGGYWESFFKSRVFKFYVGNSSQNWYLYHSSFNNFEGV